MRWQVVFLLLLAPLWADDTGAGTAAAAAAAARVECNDKYCSSYNLVSATGEILLRSPEVPIAVCSAKKWHTESNGGLERITSSDECDNNNDDDGIISLVFNLTSTGERIVLQAASIVRSSSAVVFTTILPDGLHDTSGCSNPITDPDGQIGVIVSGWPSFRYPSTTYSDHIQHSLSWTGSFLRPTPGEVSTGPRGGPTVFFGHEHVVVGSALGNYGAWSAGAGSSHDGSITDVWNPGLPISIKDVPKGWRSSTILYVTSAHGENPRDDGKNHSSPPVSITDALHSWGYLLRQYHNSTSAYDMDDVTLEKIGLQTDNGSYFCFCKGNCSDVLLRKVQELRYLGVPMGYLSFQGAGASLGKHGAPWCVSRWGADGGLGPNYPLSISDFQEALGLPLQLYAPYFCGPENDYFNDSGSYRAWKGVRSNTSLPGCKDYDFWDATPDNSKPFYDWFFAKGTSVSMVSFEPDFMNQNRNCVPEFRESVDGAELWQRGMADAASEAGLTIQWCYATPADVLSSLELDSVTNFRVSTDFCYGNSWDVGISSLLPSALGKAPSKDTLWTTTNNRTEIPGCSWTPDHEEPGAALHVTLALFTTGPVGISDGIGCTNATLIKQTISKDGTLLKPSRPATLIDSLIRKRCGSSNIAPTTRPDMSSHKVYITHSASPADSLQEVSNECHQEIVRAWYVVSFKVRQTFLLEGADLYPRPCSSGFESLTWRRFDGGASCITGTHAISTGCLYKGDVSIPASDYSNTTFGSEFGHVVTTIYPQQCKSGWRVLGELTKLVPLSMVRFPSIRCDGDAVSMDVKGSKGEVVDITAVDPQGLVEKATVEFIDSNVHRVVFGNNYATNKKFA